MFRSSKLVIKNRVMHAGIAALFGALAAVPGSMAQPAWGQEVPGNEKAEAPKDKPNLPEAPVTKPVVPKRSLTAYDQNRLHQVQEYIGSDDDVRDNLISAREAVAIARSGQMPADLGLGQRRMVEMVGKALQTPMGRTLIDAAVAQDIWLCVDNSVWGGGYYKDDLGLLTLELKDNGTTRDGAASDFTSDEVWVRSEKMFQKIMYHELAHFWQFRVRHSAVAPSGVRSADEKLWDLGIEAQAELIARVAMRQHEALDLHLPTPLPPPDESVLRAEFTHLLRGDDFHKRYYEIDKSKLDDGAILPVAQYIEAMGALPGEPGNFLQGSARSIDDIYVSTFRLPDSRYPSLDRAAAPDARPVDILSRAEIEARARLPGARLLETPDGQYAVLVEPTPIGIQVEQYKKMAGATNANVTYEAAEMTEFPFGDLATKSMNAGLTVGPHGSQYDLHIAVENGHMHVSMTHDDALTGERTLVAGDPMDGVREAPKRQPPPPGIVPAWPDIGKGPTTLRLNPAF